MTANWTPPATWLTDELVTAAKLNEQIRDNLDYLKARPAEIRTRYGAASTTSAAFVEIDPALDISLTTTGGAVLVGCTVRYIKNDTSGKTVDLRVYIDDGAAPSQLMGANFNGESQTLSGAFLVTGLAAGLHSFRLQWAAFNGGTAQLSSSGNIHFFAQEV